MSEDKDLASQGRPLEPFASVEFAISGEHVFRGQSLVDENGHPWWRFGHHAWRYTADESAREILRSAQDATARVFVGTFEARELRVCRYCQRVEQRDVYGGNYIPYGWQLRGYATCANGGPRQANKAPPDTSGDV